MNWNDTAGGGGWCCGLVLDSRRPGNTGAGVSARGLGSRGAGGGWCGCGWVVFFFYPGVRGEEVLQGGYRCRRARR